MFPHWAVSSRPVAADFDRLLHRVTAVYRLSSVWQKIQAVSAGAGVHFYGYKSELIIPFFISFLRCLGAFFRSRCSLSVSRSLPLRQQLGVLKPRPILARSCVQNRVQ